jgi:Domain of unknown function (DUF4279)
MLDEDQKWHKVSLRFLGDDLDLTAVTSALGLKPDVTGQVGEHIGGNPRYAIYETNVWVYRYTENDTLALTDQLSDFIGRLEHRAVAIRELLARPGVTAELFLGFASGNGQGGFMLPASLLARIADPGLDVSLDLYPPSVDER